MAPLILGLLSSLGGSLFGNAVSAMSAERQMDFQRDMSGTAHQRQIKDMEAAGLNPILSVTGGRGASTPSGAQFTGNPKIGTDTVASAIAARRSNQDLTNLVQFNKNQKAVYRRDIIAGNQGQANDLLLQQQLTNAKETQKLIHQQYLKSVEDTDYSNSAAIIQRVHSGAVDTKLGGTVEILKRFGIGPTEATSLAKFIFSLFSKSGG